MIVAIRTDRPLAELVLLQPNGHQVDGCRWEASRELSTQLLVRLQQLLAQREHSWKALSGVIVFQGPGSFTGLRIGITVANTIAYAQKIPIVGCRGEHWVEDGVQRLRHRETDGQVEPFYGAEANITRPKGGPPAASRQQRSGNG